MNESSVSELAARLLQGETRAIARALSLVENLDPAAGNLVAELFPHTGRSLVVGLTGPPGVGKSTLVNALAERLRPRVDALAVLAFDPSSPFTGGALLGDRARMEVGSRDPSIYIRSMATRGHVGGLASTAFEAIALLDAAGKSLILVETIGVGQDEVEIASAADMTLVVLAPGLGDDLQANKAGLMEIGDWLVVNKADRPGADQLVDELDALGRGQHNAPRVVTTVATTGDGVDALVDVIVGRLAERSALTASERASRKVSRRFCALWLRERIRRAVTTRLQGEIWESALDALQRRDQSPYEVADRLLASLSLEGDVR